MPGVAIVPRHLHAVWELFPVPRARFFFARERLEQDVLVAGIFGEAPQAGAGGFCGVHAGAWERAGRSAAEGGGGSAIDKAGRESNHRNDRKFHAGEGARRAKRWQ